MLSARKPFSRADRLVAGLLAAACFAAGAVAVVFAIERRHVVLGILAIMVLALGALYATAAWRGRPWRWGGRRPTAK